MPVDSAPRVEVESVSPSDISSPTTAALYVTRRDGPIEIVLVA